MSAWRQRQKFWTQRPVPTGRLFVVLWFWMAMVDWLEQLVWMAGELVFTRMVALGSLQPIDPSAACGLPA